MSFLRSRLAELVGQDCWDAYLPNGFELLQIEIGERRVIEGSRHKSELGAWGFIVSASSWRVTPSEELQATSDPRDKDAWAEQLRGMRGLVTRCALNHEDLSLELEFETRMVLQVVPAADGTDVPYWELFTPNGMYFQIGPGPVVIYGPAGHVA